MGFDQETINAQLDLLAAHRRRLAILLGQHARLRNYAPPYLQMEIEDTQAEVSRIKAALRDNGVTVEDAPNDEGRFYAPPESQTVAGELVVGDKTVADKITGDKRVIDTDGGDFAECYTDKRQGVFVSSGTIYGPVIGINYGSITANYTVQQGSDPSAHQLRAPVGDFVGREHEIDQLVQVLRKPASNGAAVAISGVRGMGGIGKTELAYMVANKIMPTFTDAQLVVSLRGLSTSALSPEQALQTVIRAFQPNARLPDELDELKSIYASVLAGKHVLILADDAKDAAQVRPLLPPLGSALLVTSRNHFHLPGMITLDLATLAKDEAEKLLLDICPRIGKHAPKLAELCGFLPLALRVAASFLAARSSRQVADYMAQLNNECRRLENLRDPSDPELDVPASIRLSYDGLETVVQRVLSQLCVFAASFTRHAANQIVEVPPDSEVEIILEDLCRLSLLDWNNTTQRYSLHELVRAFALAQSGDTYEARLRYANYYLNVASRAQHELHLTEAARVGLTLFAQEWIHIRVGWVWTLGCNDNPTTDALALRFAEETLSVLNRFTSYAQCQKILHKVQKLACLYEKGDLRIRVLLNLGDAYLNLRKYRAARLSYESAFYLALARNDSRHMARALIGQGAVYGRLPAPNANEQANLLREAEERYSRGLAFAQSAKSSEDSFLALCNMGNVQVRQMRINDALYSYDKACQILFALRDPGLEVKLWRDIGNAYAVLALDASLSAGERIESPDASAQRAVDFYQYSVDRALVYADILGEADTLRNWWVLEFCRGRYDSAKEKIKRLVTLEEQMGKLDN